LDARVPFERAGTPDRRRFQTNVEVDEARNLAVGEQRREAPFHLTHHEHAPIQLDEERRIGSHARQHSSGFG